MTVGATTHVAGVIGDPVAHSLSPVIHNAAFRALDLDWIFVAFPVAAGGGRRAMTGMRDLGIAGLSVTMPHKADVIPALDELSPIATAVGSVNMIRRAGRWLVGENTDGTGLVDALRRDEGWDPLGRRCVVIGAGGAGRAATHALAEAGAADVAVLNRTASRAADAAALAGGVGRVGAQDDVATADLVVNATPVGMGSAEDHGLPVDPTLLRSGQVVVDLVYHPPRTLLLQAARERGAVAVSGIGVLIHQAAHAFRGWTGEEPPLEVMSAAALAAVARRA